MNEQLQKVLPLLGAIVFILLANTGIERWSDSVSERLRVATPPEQRSVVWDNTDVNLPSISSISGLVRNENSGDLDDAFMGAIELPAVEVVEVLEIEAAEEVPLPEMTSEMTEERFLEYANLKIETDLKRLGIRCWSDISLCIGGEHVPLGSAIRSLEVRIPYGGREYMISPVLRQLNNKRAVIGLRDKRIELVRSDYIAQW